MKKRVAIFCTGGGCVPTRTLHHVLRPPCSDRERNDPSDKCHAFVASPKKGGNPTTAYAKRHSASLHCGPPPLKGRQPPPSPPPGGGRRPWIYNNRWGESAGVTKAERFTPCVILKEKKPSPLGKGDRSVEGFCGTVAKRATRLRWMRFITPPLLHHNRLKALQPYHRLREATRRVASLRSPSPEGEAPTTACLKKNQTNASAFI